MREKERETERVRVRERESKGDGERVMYSSLFACEVEWYLLGCTLTVS